MDKYIIVISNVVGLLADITAIYFTIISNNSTAVLMLVLCIVVSVIIAVLTYKYIKTKNFISFLEYLYDNPDHNFNLLPKRILMIHKHNDYNKFSANTLDVNYEYDFSKIDFDEIEPDSHVLIKDTIEYNMISENRSIPEKFVDARGNMYSIDPSVELYQKHGVQKTYERVPIPYYGQEIYTNVTTQRYSWKLLQSNISNGNSFPLSFKYIYQEKIRASSSDTIILYPIQYANRIKKLTISIKFKSDNVLITKADFYQINKHNRKFDRTAIKEYSMETISNNQVSFNVEPKCNLYEAYYIELHWELKK